MKALMQRGERFLSRRLPAADGGKISYQSGRYVIPLMAAFGRSEYQIDTGNEVKLLHTDRDFLVACDDLRLGTAKITPVPGDQITVVNSGEVYEVMPLGSDPCYRPEGTFGTRLRIHTKKISRP